MQRGTLVLEPAHTLQHFPSTYTFPCRRNVYQLIVHQLLCQEICDQLHILLPLLPMGSVARLREGEPFDLWDHLEERHNSGARNLVVCTVQKKRGHFDLAGFLNNAPVLDHARDIELGRPIPSRLVRNRRSHYSR